jgi:hypothetical protein
MRFNIKIFLALTCSFLLLIFSLLKVTPMTAIEVDEFLVQISELTHLPGGQHDLNELEAFFSADDGESFYTVNLYKYHEIAQYQTTESPVISGTAAYDKFSRVMVDLLLSHYSYPVFGSNWLDLSENDWDRIVIVKYRSRRDMAQIFSDPKFSMASAHKWASIQKHERFVVKALHLPEIYMFIVLVISILLTLLLTQNKRLSSN